MATPSKTKKTTKVVTTDTSKDERESLIAKLGIFMTKHDECDLKVNIVDDDNNPIMDNGVLRYDPSKRSYNYSSYYNDLNKSFRRWAKITLLTKTIVQSDELPLMEYWLCRFPSSQKYAKTTKQTYYSDPVILFGVRRWSRKDGSESKVKWIYMDTILTTIAMYGKTAKTKKILDVLIALEKVNQQFVSSSTGKGFSYQEVSEEWTDL